MEHRYSKRVALDIQTLIYKSGLPVAIGRVRNMSRHGMFLACETSHIALHQPLEIELLLQGRRSERATRFKCYVARKETNGIALSLFDDSQPVYARQVESLMTRQGASIAASNYGTAD